MYICLIHLFIVRHIARILGFFLSSIKCGLYCTNRLTARNHLLNIAFMHFVYVYSHYFFKSKVHCNLLNMRCMKLLTTVPAAYNYKCNYAKIFCVHGQLFIFCAVK